MFFKNEETNKLQTSDGWERHPKARWEHSSSTGQYKLLGNVNDKRVFFKYTQKSNPHSQCHPLIKASKNSTKETYWESLSLVNFDLFPCVKLLHEKKLISEETYISFVNHPDKEYLNSIKDKNISFSGNDKACGMLAINGNSKEILTALEQGNLIPKGFNEEYDLFCKEALITSVQIPVSSLKN